MRREVAGVESADDCRQRALAIGAAHRFVQPVMAGNRRVAGPGRRDGELGDTLRDVGHVAGHREHDVTTRRQETRLQARERTCVRLAVEHDAVRDQLLHLLRFAERDHHLGERWSQPVHHVPKQDRVPHLDPRLGPAHAAAAASRQHQKRRFHHR